MVRNVNNGTLKNDYFILQACLWFDELLEWIKRKTDNNWVIKVAYIKYKFPCGFEVIAKGLFMKVNEYYVYDKGCPIHGKKCKQWDVKK